MRNRPNRRYLRAQCRMELVASESNLLRAAAKARRHKTRRPDVEAWWLRREREINRLHQHLMDGTWRPAGYRFFTIHEPKRRLIAAAPFGDRVVHHALCTMMQPLVERRFIARSFSCQRGKGTTAARDVCRHLTNRHLFVLKCDARKFFPSIDHAILRTRLAREIRCGAVLKLIDLLLASHTTCGSGIAPDVFPGDDWVDAATRPRGLPIGNLTSQLWGNFYLDGLDHRITETEGHGAYLRYTDDFLIFGDDKAQLWELWEIVREELAKVRLKLSEPKSRMLATSEGVPFCGFLFHPGLKPRILGETKRRFEKRRRRHVRTGMPGKDLTPRIYAWYQFSREANSEGLRRAYIHWPLKGTPKRKKRRKSPKKFRPASRVKGKGAARQ